MIQETIPIATWNRREHVEFFRGTAIFITVQLNITRLLRVRERGYRLYPALMHCALQVVNRREEFRLAWGGDEGTVVRWREMGAMYTIPHRDNPEVFHMQSTAYHPDFHRFHAAYVEDVVTGETCASLFCKPNRPPNLLNMTAAPRLPFTAASFGGSPKEDLTPFFIFGQYAWDGGRSMLPVTGEFAHAVNDGFHISRFFEELQRACDNLATLLEASPQ